MGEEEGLRAQIACDAKEKPATLEEKEVSESTHKPGSVHAARREACDDHLSSLPIARHLKQPTRESITGRTGP